MILPLRLHIIKIIVIIMLEDFLKEVKLNEYISWNYDRNWLYVIFIDWRNSRSLFIFSWINVSLFI